MLVALASRHVIGALVGGSEDVTEAAKASMPGFRSRPVTFPVRPTRCAASRATKPVPHAMSNTCSPGRGSASAITSGAQGANTAGTSARSYVSAAFPVTCHWSFIASPCQPSALAAYLPHSLSTEAIIPRVVADAALWRTLRSLSALSTASSQLPRQGNRIEMLFAGMRRAGAKCHTRVEISLNIRRYAILRLWHQGGR
jgi:hypothetical protein